MATGVIDAGQIIAYKLNARVDAVKLLVRSSNDAEVWTDYHDFSNLSRPVLRRLQDPMFQHCLDQTDNSPATDMALTVGGSSIEQVDTLHRPDRGDEDAHDVSPETIIPNTPPNIFENAVDIVRVPDSYGEDQDNVVVVKATPLEPKSNTSRALSATVDQTTLELPSTTDSDRCGIHQSFLRRDVLMLTNGGQFDSMAPVMKYSLRCICKETGTLHIHNSVRDVLIEVLDELSNMRLQKHFTDCEKLDDVSGPLFGAVWLACCHRNLINTVPPEPSSSTCLSLALALSRQQTRLAGTDTCFHRRLQFWERRIRQLAQWKSALQKIPQTVPVLNYKQDEIDQSTTTYRNALQSASPLHNLVQAVFHNDISRQVSQLHNQVRDPARKDHLLRESILLFSTLPIEVLSSYVEASVAMHKVQRDHPLLRQLKLHEALSHQPAVYLNQIVDLGGMNPTPFQLLEVVRLAAQYGDTGSNVHGEVARQIDFAIAPPKAWKVDFVNAGFRRYLDYDKVVGRFDQEQDMVRRSTLNEFNTALRTRLESQINADHGNRPMMRPLMNVGYTKAVKKRLKQHRDHTSSNYMMNLYEAIFKVLYPGCFKLDQTILAICWRPVHPWLAEILFQEMMDCYAADGRGFCHHPPGQSNSRPYTEMLTKTEHTWAAEVEKAFHVKEVLANELQSAEDGSREQRRQEKANQQELERLNGEVEAFKNGIDELEATIKIARILEDLHLLSRSKNQHV